MLKFCQSQCDQCLFSKNRIVTAKRMKEILKDCERRDSHFECHKGTIKNKEIVCAGFFTRYSTNLIRISGRLGAINFIKPEEI